MDRSTPFRLNVLGPVTVAGPDGVAVRALLTQPRRLALLAYIAVARGGQPVARDDLLAAFWPEADADRARNALRQSLHFLRRALHRDALVTRGDHGVGLSADLVACDAHAFERGLAWDRGHEALRLVRGSFLQDLPVFGLPAVDAWTERMRRRFRDKAVRAALALAGGAAREGQRASAVEWARRATVFDPFSVPAAVALVDALGHAGDLVAAVNSAERTVARLRDDLDLPAPPALLEAADRWRERPEAPHRPPPARRIRLNLELVDPASGSRLWFGVYDRSLDDVGSLRTDIARELDRTLEAVLRA